MGSNIQLDEQHAQYAASLGTVREQAEFALLYNALNEMAHKVIYKVTRGKDEELAWDIATRIALRVNKFEGRSTFSTWAWRIATNSVLMTIRKKRIDRNFEMPLEELLEGDGPQTHSKANEVEAMLRPVSAVLKPKELQFLRTRLEGYTWQELGAKFGMSEGAARVYNHRIIKKIREVLNDGKVGEQI